MQKGALLERKYCPSETGDDKFEEMVRTSKLIPFLLPFLLPLFDVYRCALPSGRGLISLVNQNQTLFKARGKI
jgi:hypothetical protein